MRFIYLSVTKEKGSFETIEKAVNYFESFIKDAGKEFNFKGKINRKHFEVNEDIFFLRKGEDRPSYMVIAYARSSTGILEQHKKGYEEYPYFFKLDAKSVKIFPEGIDIEHFNEFVCERRIRGILKANFFTSNILNGRFIGSPAWRYFAGEDAEAVMAWFKEYLFNHTIYFVSQYKKLCHQKNNLFCGIN